MKNTTLVPALITFFSLAAFLGVMYFSFSSTNAHRQTGTNTNLVACTSEGKVCPDGSVVGRTGPNCAFAECPETNNANVQTKTNDSTDTNTNIVGNTNTESIQLPATTFFHSDLFATPYSAGDVSEIACNATYCLMASSSAGWYYTLLKFENKKFFVVDTAINEQAHVYKFHPVWNGQYWLLPYGNDVLKYDGQKLSKLSIPGNIGNNACTVVDIAWNGAVWMLATKCNYAHSVGGVILEYDGQTFKMKSNNFSGVENIAWNGSVWAFSGEKIVQADTGDKAQTIFVTYDGNTFTDFSTLFSQTSGLTNNQLAWYNQSWWLSFTSVAGQPTPRLYSFDGNQVLSKQDILKNFDNSDVGHLVPSDLGLLVGAYRSHALNIINHDTIQDLSVYLPSPLMSIFSPTPKSILAGLDNRNVLQIEFSQ